MIDITNEPLLTFAEAAQRLRTARSGKPPHLATLYRWASKGVDGVVLESVKLGGSRFTTQSAIERFAVQGLGMEQGRSANPERSGARDARTGRVLRERGLDDESLSSRPEPR